MAATNGTIFLAEQIITGVQAAPEGTMFQGPWQGAAVLVGYATVLAVAGAAAISRRDVP